MTSLVPNADLAELTGILLGDGSIGKYQSKVNGKIKTQYRVKVTGDASDDFDYFVKIVAPLMTRVFHVEPKVRFKSTEHVVELLLFGPKLFNALIEIGFIEAPKKGRAMIPAFITEMGFQREFLRGFFDTDGSLVFDKQHKEFHYYPRLEMKIDKSPMRNQLLCMLRDLGFNPRKCAQEGKVLRVQLNGKASLETWATEIGFKNPKHLSKHLFWCRFGYYCPKTTLQERYNALGYTKVYKSEVEQPGVLVGCA